LPGWLKTLAAGDLRGAAEAHIRKSRTGLSLEALRPRLNRGLKPIETVVTELAEAGRVFEVSPGVFIHAEMLVDIGDGIVETLETYQSEKRLKWGMPKEELRERLGSVEMSFFNWVLSQLEADGRVFIRKGSIRAGTGDVQLGPDEERARSLVIDSLKADMFQPPSERDLEGGAGVAPETVRKVIALLVEDGLVIRLEPGLIVHADAVEEATEKIRAYLKQHGEATASDLKTALGTTRKYAVPLLEHLDRLGVTRRHGATRTLAL
jgi:selenocysteine-specific elongation factor